MKINEVVEFHPELTDVLRRLLSQLSSDGGEVSDGWTRRLVESQTSRLIFAKEQGVVLGMLTVVIFPIPSGVRAWIEDVVVDEAARGKGLGELLIGHALGLAKSQGAKTVELTSRPSREAANRLYQRIGFYPRETNVYRFDFENDKKKKVGD